MQLKTPLDFYMVADHAEYMGVFNQMSNPDNPISKTEIAKGVTSPDANVRLQTFAGILRDMSEGKRDPQLSDPALARTVWSEIIKAADANYVPGKFTTFAGFEWTSNPQKRNLHRVIVFRDTKHLPDLVLSALDSDDPEVLWKWMDDQRAKGSTLFAIPHNGNASDGLMFDLVKRDGKPIDAAYNKTRADNEPLYEITQIKGTSETHPDLSPTDEFAGFEQWDYTLSADFERPKHRKGSFVRQALLDGMSQAANGAGNPFKYGFIGDTDTHNAAASNEEFNFTGKFAFENNAKERLTGVPGAPAGQMQQIQEFSSGGLAGVWAPQNTREAIWDAMQRKETFGTSGPMMKVRFFGSFDYAADDVNKADFVKLAYAKGVPMGGDLSPAGPARRRRSWSWRSRTPRAATSTASRSSKAGSMRPASSTRRSSTSPGPATARSARMASCRRLATALTRRPRPTPTAIGAAQLATGWTDPDFKPGERAFYYARVLEIPTPRWNTYDAVRLNMAPLTKVPATIQERAWSSPIWYSPAK